MRLGCSCGIIESENGSSFRRIVGRIPSFKKSNEVIRCQITTSNSCSQHAWHIDSTSTIPSWMTLRIVLDYFITSREGTWATKANVCLYNIFGRGAAADDANDGGNECEKLYFRLPAKDRQHSLALVYCKETRRNTLEWTESTEATTQTDIGLLS